METEEAIENIKIDIATPLACGECTICNIEDLETLLNHLTKQEKMIELMSKHIRADDIDEDICQYQGICNEYECEECIKQYFEKKAEESE